MKQSEIRLQSWAIYESNVQNYRAYSSTVQSFFLTIGSVLFTANDTPLYLLFMIVGIGILHVFVIWIPVVFARNYIVDYHKFQSELGFGDAKIVALAKVCTEREYVNNKSKRKVANEQFFNGKGNRMLRATRFKFDVCVPLSYVAIWIALFMWKIFPIILTKI